MEQTKIFDLKCREGINTKIRFTSNDGCLPACSHCMALMRSVYTIKVSNKLMHNIMLPVQKLFPLPKHCAILLSPNRKDPSFSAAPLSERTFNRVQTVKALGGGEVCVWGGRGWGGNGGGGMEWWG